MEKERIKEITDKALETAQGSVFAPRRLRERIWNRFGQYPHREELLQTYDDGVIDRRQFLAILGFGAAGVAAGTMGSRFFFGDPERDWTLTGHQTADGFNVERDGNVSPGGDISSVINSNQGERIIVPSGEFRAENTITIDGSTELIFEETELVADSKNYVLFDADGDGWHIGGDVNIDQSQSYPRVQLSGSGQFGDENGRISFRGECPNDVIGVKRESPGTGFLRISGSQSDTIRFMNVDQHEGPPKNECADANFIWTEYPGTFEVIGCHIGNFHDNGFYVKAMKGRLEIYDSYLINNNVAAVRNGVTRGVVMERCHVRTDGNENPARTAGRHCAGINHSMMAFQDTGGAADGQTGDVLLNQVCYTKEGGNAGEFLREGPGTGGGCTVTIRDCTWPSHPDYGSGASVVTVQEEGNNSSGDCEAEQAAYPYGGGPRRHDSFGSNTAPDTTGTDTDEQGMC